MQIKLKYIFFVITFFLKTVSHKPIKLQITTKKNHIMIQVYDERVEAKIGKNDFYIYFYI